MPKHFLELKSEQRRQQGWAAVRAGATGERDPTLRKALCQTHKSARTWGQAEEGKASFKPERNRVDSEKPALRKLSC